MTFVTGPELFIPNTYLAWSVRFLLLNIKYRLDLHYVKRHLLWHIMEKMNSKHIMYYIYLNIPHLSSIREDLYRCRY